MGNAFTKTLIVDGVDHGTELVTNGDFSSDSDWTKGTGWSIAGGVASHVDTATASCLYLALRIQS